MANVAPLINTVNASQGEAFNETQVSQLPIEARNVVSLLSLQPGVTHLGDRIDANSDTRSGAVNGVRSDQSNVTLDGVDVNDQNNGYAFTSVLHVTPDSVQEFRVTTGNAGADQGHSARAQVALVTKSGTNRILM
ncbi:MAG: TonB-dependent receptor plug domain-containing protein [Terriglobia bacterium]